MNATVPNSSADEKQLRELIKQWTAALEAKDADRLVADYAPDAVLYDAIPPYKTIGPDNIKKAWEACLPYFPESFKSEHRDLEFHISGDIAVVNGLHHFVAPDDPNDPCTQTWMRITVCYRRIDGKWKVFHEHVSLPFNPMDSKSWQIPSPEDVSVPDYSGADCK